jgi:alpha-L-fucosidase
MKIIELDTNWVVIEEYIKLMNMTVKEKRRIIEQHVIQILRRQLGGNNGIHKIKINDSKIPA